MGNNCVIIYTNPGLGQIRLGSTLWQMHKRGGTYKKRKPSKNPFDGQPFMKGVVLKTVIKKPKKPNSANRKCVVVKLSNGKEMTAYVPGKIHIIRATILHLILAGLETWSVASVLESLDGLNYFRNWPQSTRT